MKTILKILLLSVFIGLMAFSCEKEKQLPANQAEGTIVANLHRCYGYSVLIEIDNPQGIGNEGTYMAVGEPGPEVKYTNAIGVPYFERIPDLITNAQDSVGTWLRFEYRELTSEERNSQIFVDTAFHGICNELYGPPDVPMYIITKVIDHH